MTTHKEYSEKMADALLKTLVISLLEGAVARLPFLANPVLGFIFKYLAEKILKWGIYNAKMRLYYAHTDLRTSQQGRSLEKSIDRLIEAQKTNDKTLIKEAEKKLEKDLIDLVVIAR